MRPALVCLFLLAPLASAATSFVDGETGAPPTVQLLAPEDGAGAAGTLALRGTAEDPDTTVEDVQVRVDHGAWTSVDVATRSVPATAWSHALDLSALPPGEHLVEVRATDGGAPSTPVGVRVATDFGNAPPSLRVVTPQDGAAFAPGAVVGVVLAAADADGRVATVEMRADGGAWTPAVAGEAGTWTARVDGLGPGVHTLEARAMDERGASSVVLASRVAVGRVSRPPVVEIAAPVHGQGFTEDGGPGCIAVRPCILVSGVTDAPATGLAVSVDEGPEESMLSGLALVGVTWRFEWPVADAYAGAHTFRVRAIGPDGDASVPQSVRVELAGARTLAVRVLPGVVRTGEPFGVRVSGAEAPASVQWLVDGRAVANATSAELSVPTAGLHEILARVRDARGRTGVAAGLVQVLDRPPVVTLAISPYPPRVGDVVVFDADAVDPDGRVVAWRFDFGDGSATPWLDRAVVAHTYARKGDHTASVTVRDEAGSLGSALLAVEIANSPPFATIQPTSRRPQSGESVRFQADVADPDDRSFTYLWEFPGGTQATTRVASHAFDEPGPAVVALEVTDPDGAVAFATYALDVQDVAPAASFNITPREPTTVDLVRFEDRSVDRDGRVVRFAWDFGDGNTSTDAVAYHRYAREGNYLVRLHATDDADGVGLAERIVRVGNGVPRVEFGWSPAYPSIADTVAFTGRVDDVDGKVLDAAWSIDGAAAATGTEMAYRFPLRRTYNVTLAALDDRGAVGSLVRPVEVVNGLPVVTLPDVVTAHVGEPVALQAQAVDADGAVVEVRWDADGDGVDDHVGTAQTFAWTYTEAGVYGASFTAVDDVGAAVSGWTRVEVTRPPPDDDAPAVTILSPVDGALVSGPARIEGSASDDFGVQLVEWQVRDGDLDVYPGGGGWAAASGVSPWQATLDSRVLANGAHALVVRAWDGRQWSDVDVRVFRTLNDPQETPTVALQVLVPAPDARLSGRVTLQGASYHPQGVARVLVGVDGQDLQPANGTASWAYAWDTRNVSSGEHVLTFRAELASGLYRVTKVKVHVNNDPPTLYVRPIESSVLRGLVTLRGNVAVDRDADVVLVRVDGGPAEEAIGTTRWSWSFDTRTLDDGPHEIEVVAVGSDGLPSWPHKVAIEVRNAEPPRAPEPAPKESPAGALAATLAALGLAAWRRARL